MRCGKREKVRWEDKKKRIQERVRSVAADPYNSENSKEEGGEHKLLRARVKNCTSRESVSPLSRSVRGFRNRYK